MRIVEQQAWADGDIITPDEMNAEFNSIVGVLNGGVDRDNILDANVIARGKVKEGELSETNATSAVNVAYILRTETMDGQIWLDVPNMSLTVATGDTSLVLTGQVDGESAIGATPGAFGGTLTNLPWEIGILVDGRLICRSDTSNNNARQSIGVEGVAFVAAGTHTVKMVMRITPGGGPQAGKNHNVKCTGRLLYAKPRIR